MIWMGTFNGAAGYIVNGQDENLFKGDS